MIKRLGTFCVINHETGRSQKGLSRERAMQYARDWVGNNSYAKPFIGEETYFFGRGDGTTSVIVQEEVEFVRLPEEPQTTYGTLFTPRRNGI